MSRRTPSLASFLIIQVFWATLYSTPIFQLLGGINGQGILLATWIVALLVSGKAGIAPAIRNLSSHGGEVSLLVIFLAGLLLNLLFGRGGYSYLVKTLLLSIAYVTVVVHLRRDYLRYRQAVVTVTIVLGATAIFDLPTLIKNPLIGRFYEFAPGELQWFGSWGFFMTYAIALPICLAVAQTHRGVLRIALLMSVAAFVLLILVSSFAASIILMLFGFAGFAVFSMRRVKTYVLTGVLVVLSAFATTRFDLVENRQFGTMATKVRTIFSLGNSASIADPQDPRIRVTLMLNSLRAFTANPLFGTGVIEDEARNDLIGRHSGFVDALAQFGLVGLSWYLAFLGIRMRRLLVALRREPMSAVHQGRALTVGAFCLGAIANPMLFDVGICTIVFIAALSPIGSLPDDTRVVGTNPIDVARGQA